MISLLVLVLVPSLATPEQKPNAVNSQQAQPVLQGQNPTPTVTKRKKSSLNEEKRVERLNGYSYTVINSNNKKEKGYFDAETGSPRDRFSKVLLIISLKTSLSVIFCKISILSVMKTPWFNNEANVLVKFAISL